MYNKLAAVAFVLLIPLAGKAQAPAFRPISIPEHSYQGGWAHFVGGGVASFDCNGDNMPELYAAGGSENAVLLKNQSKRGGPISLVADTPVALAITGVTGAYSLDIDSDGLIDLVILRAGPNLLLKGDGECGFNPFDGFEVGTDDRWTTAFSATWEGAASLPTLAFGNYVDRTAPDGPFGACDDSELYRPIAGGYPEALPLTPAYCPLSMLFSDWGRNGRADLRVSNDRHYYIRDGQEQLWAMEAHPRLFGPDDGWRAYQIWGMGIASRDITGNGLPEVYLTSMADQKMQSLTRVDNPDFQDATYAMGITAQRPYTGGDGRPSTGWHVSFGDVQNDGRDDIFVAKGNVDQMPGSAMEDPNNLLIQGEDGVFEEFGATAGVASLVRSRGAALVDLNLDGQLDLAVVNRRAPMEVYQNVTPNTGHWVSVDLSQPAPNVNAIGAWIEVKLGARVIVRELTVGGGHAGGTLVPQHFGLGAHSGGALRVIWPDGTRSGWHDFSADALLRITRAGDALEIETY